METQLLWCPLVLKLNTFPGPCLLLKVNGKGVKERKGERERVRLTCADSAPLWPPPGTDVKEAQVICVSTGTKCINGEYMSDRGLALNDCHAEIIARRSLIRYLYTQLEFFLR